MNIDGIEIKMKAGQTIGDVTKYVSKMLVVRVESEDGRAYNLTVKDGKLTATPVVARATYQKSKASIERDLPTGYSPAGNFGNPACSCGKNDCDGNSPYCG